MRSLTCPSCRVAIDVPPPPRMTTEPTAPASSPPPSSQSANQPRIEKPSPPAPAPSLPPRKAPPVASPPSQVKPDSDSSSVTPDPAAATESSLPPQLAVLPKVSVHVPAYNEPAAMVIETLDAMARLDYPDFEVLVIDNNTPGDEAWRPVEAHCQALGPLFRFFHVRPLAGFKAGALNYALERTAPSGAGRSLPLPDQQAYRAH